MTPAAGIAHTEQNVSGKILSNKVQGGPPAAHDGVRTERTECLRGSQHTPYAEGGRTNTCAARLVSYL